MTTILLACDVDNAHSLTEARARLDAFREAVIPSQNYGLTFYEPNVGAAVRPVTTDRWADHSPAFKRESPWCGWTLAFAHGSDWDTTSFGLERLVNINVLLTTADGHSRPVIITAWQHIDPAYLATRAPNREDERMAGVLTSELDPEDYEPIPDRAPVFVPYEDIREIVVF